MGASTCHARQVLTEVMEQKGSQIELIMLESCKIESLNQFKIQSEKQGTEEHDTLRAGCVPKAGPHCLNPVVPSVHVSCLSATLTAPHPRPRGYEDQS